MATGIKVKDVMKRGVVTVKQNDGIRHVSDVMSRADVGGVIVFEEGKILGILTEGDIIKEVISRGLNYNKVKVKDIMKHPVRTITPDLDLEDAAKVMRDLSIERLPVIRNDKLVGIITERDMIRIEPALLELMQLKCAAECVPASERNVSITGECESCGSHSEVLRSIETKYLCDECRTK